MVMLVLTISTIFLKIFVRGFHGLGMNFLSKVNLRPQLDKIVEQNEDKRHFFLRSYYNKQDNKSYIKINNIYVTELKYK